jgi:ATP-dependent Clp protease adaptor protein ClpS
MEAVSVASAVPAASAVSAAMAVPVATVDTVDTIDAVAPADVEIPDETLDEDRPWVTIVWDDPINLMSYVTYVFQKLFGYSFPRANRLMLDVHQRGRATVSSGSRDEMERDTARLHAYGLWATIAQG